MKKIMQISLVVLSVALISCSGGHKKPKGDIGIPDGKKEMTVKPYKVAIKGEIAKHFKIPENSYKIKYVGNSIAAVYPSEYLWDLQVNLKKIDNFDLGEKEFHIYAALVDDTGKPVENFDSFYAYGDEVDKVKALIATDGEVNEWITLEETSNIPLPDGNYKFVLRFEMY